MITPENPWIQKFLQHEEWAGSLDRYAAESKGIYMDGGDYATIMPPSIFAQWLRYKFEPQGQAAHVEADWELSPSYYKVVQRWRSLHPNNFAEMITYRSRLSFAYGPLRANEVDKQTRRAQEGSSRVQAMLATVESERDEAFYAWFDVLNEVKGKLKLGEHTQTFIKEHKYASFTPGRKWPGITEEELALALEANIANIEYICEEPDRFKLSTGNAMLMDPDQWNRGMRGRNVALDDVATFESGHASSDLEYARLIRYFLGRNMNPFLEDRKLPYEMLFDKTANIYGIRDIVACPIEDGAGIFEKLYTAAEGNYYYNYDANGWDGHVPPIMDNGAIAIPEGCEKMTSGMDMTSANGSAAHIAWVRMLLNANPGLDSITELIAILSDDGGWVLNQEIDKTMLEVPSVYECDTTGTRMKHYLGFSMLDDQLWHPVGIKLSVEKVEKGIKLPPFTWSESLTSEYDALQIETIENIYMGEALNGQPMREVLGEVDIMDLDYISPSQIQQLIVDNLTTQQTPDERGQEDSDEIGRAHV